MRKPEVTLKEIPEVRERIRSIREVPRKFYGMEYEYSHVVSPEECGGLLVLRWYSVEKALEEGDYAEEYITYINAAKEEWITYIPAAQKWSRATLEYDYGWTRTLVIHPERVEAYGAFTGGCDHPLEPVVRWQLEINGKKLKKRQKKKDNETNRLMEQAEPLTEEFLRWHEETAMKDSRYLIYERSGKNMFCAYCTHCRGVMDVPAPECKDGRKWECPKCGSRLRQRSSGFAKRIEDTAWTEYVQAIEEGLMIRFIRMAKIYRGQTEPERIVSEPLRIVIARGKEPVWYEKRESHTTYKSSARYQKNQGELCVHGYNYPKEVMFRGIYRKGLKKELKKAFPYHEFAKWLERRGGKLEQYSVYDYFATYSILPLIESLEKTGKAILVDEIVKNTGIEGIRKLRWIDRTAKTVSGTVSYTQLRAHETGGII